MADLEFIALPPPVAESFNLLAQRAEGAGAGRSSSWERIQRDARLQNLSRSERLALAAALMEHGQALVNQACSDVDEATEAHPEIWPRDEAVVAAERKAGRACRESIFCFETATKVVQRRYYDEDDGLDEEVSRRVKELVSRVRGADIEWGFPRSHNFRLDVETVIVGFVALKVLGPFAEAFAKKLGELLAERTERAVGRIQLIRRNRRPHIFKVEMSPGTTILVLPEDLDDEAKLAILDLDLTIPHRAPMRWKSVPAAWEEDQPGA